MLKPCINQKLIEQLSSLTLVIQLRLFDVIDIKMTIMLQRDTLNVVLKVL